MLWNRSQFSVISHWEHFCFWSNLLSSETVILTWNCIYLFIQSISHLSVPHGLQSGWKAEYVENKSIPRFLPSCSTFLFLVFFQLHPMHVLFTELHVTYSQMSVNRISFIYLGILGIYIPPFSP